MELSLDVLLSVPAWNQIDDCNFTETEPQIMYFFSPPLHCISSWKAKEKIRGGEAKDEGNKMRRRERRTEF